MTRFTVAWWPDAENELARLWLQTTSPGAMASAADEVDWMLRAEPTGQGSEAGGSLRLLTVDPLSVLFSVAPDDCKVIVWAVRANPNS